MKDRSDLGLHCLSSPICPKIFGLKWSCFRTDRSGQTVKDLSDLGLNGLPRPTCPNIWDWNDPVFGQTGLGKQWRTCLIWVCMVCPDLSALIFGTKMILFSDRQVWANSEGPVWSGSALFVQPYLPQNFWTKMILFSDRQVWANSEGPVWSGSALFAQTCLPQYLGLKWSCFRTGLGKQ